MKIDLSSDRHFLSIQGEGPSMGHPAVFIRVAGCTLACKWCDTIEVWKKHNPIETEDLVDELVSNYARFFAMPHFRLILTGGSPVKQDEELAFMMGRLYARPELSVAFQVECETEATLVPRRLTQWVDRWNVSPKLASSGMPRAARKNPEALSWHASNKKSIFKFAVRGYGEHSGKDILEVNEIVKEFEIPRERVWLMPVVSRVFDHARESAAVVRDCLAHGYNFSPRLQVAIWDKTTGV